ncbi:MULTISPECIES: hypothetical protein [unclassified Halomonas]|uniref:hypothetical protein n=1 Tax=unclassified Halomonas TaxID=2609666 RepID=UPI0006DB58B9|nr:MULTISPECIES: hypothetical protein [unclassified Halomonas]KPQ20235.1 MAG: hypothetical protein HLUCCO06_05250 [Halomonas sp. HL-93]SBR51048.1 hypothetical protein GA0071314_2998 [Halomonas sp. HL-93]SNY97168.1 hypothetical protein SAMN04488142_1745 [Halomonas sp. hl-4]
MIKIALALSTLILISGCAHDSNTETSDVTESGTATEQSASHHQMTDQWVGRWTGVEGLFLEISKDESAGAGHYRLHMRYGLDADQIGTFEGQATAEGIRFNRGDGPQLLRAGDGEATGMKWLMEKEDCLIVRTGEGYCRD